MKASVGDRIVVASTVVDQPLREGRVVELRHGDGSPPYIVEWTDTAERTLVFPGADARIEHLGSQPAPSGRVLKRWTVQVTITEEGNRTTATAVLGVEAHDQLAGAGSARRNPKDPTVPVIGDEVAVARALHGLADSLLEVAEADITSSTGEPAQVLA